MSDLCLCTTKADTINHAILEALVCGTPVVATAVGGIPEQIEGGVTGFLAPAGDAASMAARIEQLLSH
jgi:glycosyltransferase involved in cell wall biosynthesis